MTSGRLDSFTLVQVPEGRPELLRAVDSDAAFWFQPHIRSLGAAATCQELCWHQGSEDACDTVFAVEQSQLEISVLPHAFIHFFVHSTNLALGPC